LSRRVAFAAIAIGLTAGVPAAPASAPPVGAIPKGPVTTIATTKGQLIAVALPHATASSGLVWRLARSLDARVVREVSEADVGASVVIVFKAVGVGRASIVYALTRGESSKAQQSKTFDLRVSSA
jgi:hypothetical protein